MNLTKDKRNEMIEALIDNDLQVNGDDIVRDLLRGGWKGYANLTDDELQKEFDEAGLVLDEDFFKG